MSNVSGPHAFPKARHLRRPAEFAAVLRSRARQRDDRFAMTALKTEGESRLGITVSRKVSRRAVDRNRIKRQVRESFRHHWAALGGWDIVITAQPGAAMSANPELRRSLEQHWDRLRRRCAPSSSS